MMKFILTACITLAAICITVPLVVKGDTTDGSQELAQANQELVQEKVEVVNDTCKNKENVTEETEIEVQSVVEVPKHSLDDLMYAIMYIESRGNEKAYNPNGDCVGALQITKICVRECNNILKKLGFSKRYSYADRWNKQKSIEMFYLIQDYHNPSHDINKAIRLWNKSQQYKNKVLKRLNSKK